MNICKITLLLLAISTFAFAGTTVPFPQLTKPGKIFVDKDYIYVTEFPKVFIYSKKDLKLLKSFGRSGEGPQEFKEQIHLTLQDDSISVQSDGKMSRFSRLGKLQKEFRCSYTFRVAKALDNLLVVGKGVFDNKEKTFYLVATICKEDFTPIKEIDRYKHFFQTNAMLSAVYLGRGNLSKRMTPLFYTYRKHIFLETEHGETSTILVFNKEGKKVSTIKHDYEKVPFTSKHKQQVIDFFTVNRSRLYQIVKQRKLIFYPDYFPTMRIFSVADDKVYVVPYKKKQSKSEFHIFDFQGKLLKKALVDLTEQNIFDYYPYAVSQGKIYQLIENSETEEWELVIRKLRD